MYGCESWTLEKAESWRIDDFELWCWRRLLRVPWTARRSNQLILKGISPEYSLEGLMLKLKLQYFGHLIQRMNSFEKILMLGKLKAEGEGDDRGWDGWMASLMQWTWVWVGSGSWWWTGKPGMLQSMRLQSWTRLSNWTELKQSCNKDSILTVPVCFPRPHDLLKYQGGMTNYFHSCIFIYHRKHFFFCHKTKIILTKSNFWS